LLVHLDWRGDRRGAFADLQKGRRVEIKYEDPSRRDVAEWVRVEVDR